LSTNRPAAGPGHSSQARFAAKLTDAAYAVALRHGVSGSWIDLQLELWRALTEAIERAEPLQAACLDECTA
jgi:hypothetical protein